jgi:uncharacterized protein (TIGR00297 family)
VLDRRVNIFFTLALVFVFVLFGDAQDHKQILIGIFLASLVCVAAFIINWLTVDGAISAAIFGSLAYGLGGLAGAAVVLAFFISGSLVSDRIISKEGFLEKKFRRNAKQVWANGFWFSLWILVWFLSGTEAFMIAAVTSISASSADTWATEIGDKRLKGKARLLTTWEKVPSGTDGGVSFWGTIAAFLGAVFITVIFWIFSLQPGLPSLLVISLVGFSGCIVDSYLGARFQNQENKFLNASFFGIENVYVSNNFVNWISAGIASIISLILILIIGI